MEPAKRSEEIQVLIKAEKILIFKVSDEYFAFPLTDVSSVGAEVNVVHLPQMPTFIEGILNLRGEMLPAIHLAKRLQLKVLPISEATRHVVIKRKVGNLVFIVDELIQIARVSEFKIEHVPHYLEETAKAPFIMGIFESKKGVVSLLDLDELFSQKQMEELFQFEEIAKLKAKSQKEISEEEKRYQNEREKLEKLIEEKLKAVQSPEKPEETKKDKSKKEG